MIEEDPPTMELLSRLKELGVTLRAEGGRLRIEAPKGNLDEALREELSRRKAEIIQFLGDVTSTRRDVMPLLPAPRDRGLPLSFSQERLWFLSQMEPENAAYNISLGISLPGQLRVDILKRSLDEMLRRHEALRTIFAEEEGWPVQIVSPPGPFDLQITNLQGVPEAQRGERTQQIVTGQTLRPFDLSKGPLFRAALIQSREDVSFLIVTMHHIITDRWSFGIFSREITSLYQAYSENKSSPLAELPIQFADFAYSLRMWLAGDVLESQLSYWKHKLSGDLQPLQLPADRPRPAVQTYDGGRRGFTLTRDLSDKLKALTQSEGVTLFMTLLAGFKVLLYRYTEQTDVAVGSPIANRSRAEVEQLIGFFANTLVLRTDLSGNPRFLDLLSRVKDTVLGALSNQDAPFEKLVEAVNVKRDTSYSPLFQVMFAFQNVPRTSVDLRGWSFFDTGASMFDLTLYMWEEEKGIAGEVEYNVDLFDAGTMDRMTEHFTTLLEGIVANPMQRLSTLPILKDSEKRRLLQEWNNTTADFPREKCFKQIFEERASATPDRIAVMCAGRSLTYRELNSRANQVASHLRKSGVRPDSIVGVYVGRSLDMTVSLLGVLKSGATYLPLDPSFPQDRVQFMLEDSRALFLITRQNLSERLRDFSGKVIRIDSDWGRISKEDTADLTLWAGPDDLCYVIYTSGSTGKPKGVQIANRSLTNFLFSMQKEPGLTEADTLLSVTTMSFDIFGLELFLPLSVGAKVVIAEHDDILDGSRLARLLERHETTVMQATPSTWRLLIESGWSGSENLRGFCGGEALTPDLVGPLLERCKELWNLYGPTETTIWSIICRVTSTEDPVLIGTPIANTQVYILDGSSQPVPIGVVGELHIGGVGLSRGYLNRPELTAGKFIRHPILDQDEIRVYKTGDVARYRPDGRIECLGRIDHQVKLNGFRIELGEIEARLKDTKGVSNSVVVVHEYRPGDKRLVAYVVGSEGTTVDIGNVNKQIRNHLPDYMVPSAIVQLDELPLTPGGKIDRATLARLAPPQQVERIEASSEPLTCMEEVLVGIWKEVLSLDQVSVDDNFFEIGGRSLLSVQVISRLEKKIGLRINPREFIYQTLGQLAASIEQQRNAAVPVEPRAKRETLWDRIRNRMSSENSRD